MDSDLFMECEEEELEPWQQLSSVDDSGGNVETAEANIPEPKTVVIPNLPTVVNTASTVPLLTNTSAPQVVHTADIPQTVQGQQVILAPGGGGLGTVALSPVLLPGTSPIANATSHPIYFTTQGLPVQNIHHVQPGQNPMGLVLNVQQGQTVQPITLFQAPGTQIFKPAVGATQIITQPAQIRTVAPVANRVQTPSSFSTVQIPATLTIRTTTAVTQPKVNTMASTAITQPSPTRTTKIVTIKQGNGPLDMQNLMSLVKSVTLPGGAQAQTFVVMSNQKNNGPSVASSVIPVTPQNVVQTIPVTNTSPSSYQMCPRCGAQFKMIEALRSHMCFCCPDQAQMTGTSGTAPAVSTPATPPKNLSVVPKINTESQPIKTGESKLVMLVDDFYYGTFEGNRVYVPMDNSKEPLSFKCHSCNKKLKNNIRFMNHMRNHVELEQQNGEMDTHTSCQHCFRRFPTPFRLQCHLESVHTAIESSTKCKICEWSFDSEPVFLQHMKSTHKPGEMPYVCQVCEYRSSFYSDVFNHFRTWHEDTRHLLCQYCLKVFKHSSSFQQHYVRHQKSTVYHCNKCRLQFLFTKDKVEHKINHHRTFRKPRELEGLQPGTKVTIRAYVGQKKTSGHQSSKASPQNSKSSNISSQTSTDQQSQRPGPGRKQVSKMFDYLAKFQEQRALLGRQKCLECTFDIPDFANHYPTYVHCSLCLYSTCCSRAYANHMINNHVPGRVPKASKKGPPSGLKLSCADCDYSTALGNLMAKHLVKFPSHSHCIFTRRGNAKVGFIAPKKFKVMRYVPSREGKLTALGYKMGKIKTERGLRRSSLDTSSISGAGLDEDMDQEMAPLEDEDTDTDTDNSDEEQPHQTVDRQRNDTVTNSTLTQPVKHREDILSIRQRRILLLALCCGIQKASKEMGTKPQVIKTWLRDKEKQVKFLGEGSRSSCGDAGEHLVEWVLAQREQQRPISEAKLFEKASELQSQTNDSSFCISYEWAVSFMLQHKLGLDASVAVRELPQRMEDNCCRFIESVHSQIQTNNVQQCVICAMDQLSVFVDFNMMKSSINRERAFQLTGSGKPFVKIYLSMLADGTVLPVMLFTSPGASKLRSSPSDSILLMSKEEGFSASEELEVWATQVWKQHLDSQNEKEALLVMDSHHSNVSEEFISTVSSTKTLTAIVPVGCTYRHQPLEMCVRPVLQRLFHSRWAQQSAKYVAESEVQPEDLMQLLVSWLEEAISCFSSKPEVIQHSFCLAHVIPDQEDHANLPGSPLDLLNLLSEAVLGPEVIDSESSEEEPMDTCAVDKVGQVTEKIDLTQESEAIEICTGDKTSQVAEKIDLTQENEVDQTDDEDRAQSESNETEQQMLERMEECLEISSESTDFSHSSPESEAPSHNSEQDDISESGLDPNDDQTDSASNR